MTYYKFTNLAQQKFQQQNANINNVPLSTLATK